MIFPASIRLLSLTALILSAGSTVAHAWEPLRAHPQNPYILEFRGQPTVLRSYSESYSFLTNSEMPIIPYLDVLKRDGMNLTRVWCLGFPPDDPSSPSVFLQPWPRATTGGNALDGLKKWDLSIWNEAYFTRLKEIAQAASDRGIVVEFTLFSVFYGNTEWQAGPFHPSNNVQGYGPNNWNDTLREVNANLLAVQQAAVRRIANELNEFDNIIIEIVNEPFWNEPDVKDAQEVTFHNNMLAVIRSEEATLPNRHLIAHNYVEELATISPDFDIINEHYPVNISNSTVNIGGAEALLANHYSRGKILSLDETDTSTAIQTRLEAWMFLIGGGGIYDGLDGHDYVYSHTDPTGDTPLGNSIRTAVRNAGTYLDNLNLVALRRNLAWVISGIPTGSTMQAMATPGQQYAAYFHHGKKTGSVDWPLRYDPIDSTNHTLAPTILLDPGTWRAVWTNPSDLAVLRTETFTHNGGLRTLTAVTYQADIALRIDRTGSGDATPPPSPANLTAVFDGSISVELTWSSVQAADISAYRIYRSETTPVPADQAHRIAEVVPPATSHTDVTIEQDHLYHYIVTAVDLSGNESPALPEARVFTGPPPPTPIDYPPLTITPSGESQYQLEWPSQYPEWNLQESPDLTPASWTLSTETPAIVNNYFRVTVTATPAGIRFFRLAGPAGP